MDLRVAILGAGSMGQAHAKNVSKLAEAKVVAVCSRQLESAKRLSAELPGTVNTYTDFQDMLDSEDIDLLYVCLPPSAHRGEVEAAAAKGIHLFLEKPIAMDSNHAQRMVSAIEAAGVKSQVGFHLRFRKSVLRLKELLDAGKLGQPCLFSGRYWANMEGSDWWRDRNRSGGQVFEQVIHIYDMANFLFGKADTAKGIVTNLLHNDAEDYTIEDNSVGIIRFKNGANGVITGTNCATPNHFIGDFRAVFENATVDYQCSGQNWLKPDIAKIMWATETEEFTEDEDPYLAETVDLINAIREDRETLTPVQAGLEAIELVEMVMQNNIND